MSIIPYGWTNNTANRFVAFLDIMGFKDLVYRNKHEDVLATMNAFQPIISEINMDFEKRLKGENGRVDLPFKSSIRAVTFSDSVLIVSSDNTFDSAVHLIQRVKLLMRDCLKKGIPIKGAIAFGEQTDDFETDLHVGRPIIDAFELQSQLSFYGVTLHHTAEQRLKAIDALTLLHSDLAFLVFYPTPLKSCVAHHYNVNLINLARPNDAILLEAVENLCLSVSGSNRQYVDNTRAFLVTTSDFTKNIRVKILSELAKENVQPK